MTNDENVKQSDEQINEEKSEERDDAPLEDQDQCQSRCGWLPIVVGGGGG